MAREFPLLISDFRKKLQEAIKACAARGVHIEVFHTLVLPIEQAALWRQGRTTIETDIKALALEKAGAPYLAKCLRDARPQATNIATYALPGYSWHQWGEAATCVWVDSCNKLNWSNVALDRGVNGYSVLAEEVTKLDLTVGSGIDQVENNWTHVQYRPTPSPEGIYNLIEVDAEMRQRFPR